MNYKVMVKALNVIKDSVVNTEFPLTNKLADAIYAIEAELTKPETPEDLLRQSEREGWRYAKELEAALAKPEQEPNKEWVGLTGIEVRRLKDIHIPIYSIPILDDYLNFYRAIENELKDKNTTN